MLFFNLRNNVENRPHISGKIRAYGKARLDMARRATSRQEWEALWKESRYPFPFKWGNGWRYCMEYRVDDFAAEVGFLIDILGFPVVSLDDNYAMFTGPEGDFYFVVVAAEEGQSTPADAIRLQFMIQNIYQVAEELQRRGIELEHEPQVYAENSSLHYCSFRTPHGITIDLWDNFEKVEVEPEREIIEQKPTAAARSQAVIAQIEAAEDFQKLDDDEEDDSAGDGFEDIKEDGFEYIREPKYEDVEEPGRVYDLHVNNELHYQPIPLRKN
jgi:catechol 2,3-dioxygenase-like lactoylglutathione lyase family enzyme